MDMNESPWPYYISELAKLREHLTEHHPSAMADPVVAAYLSLMEEDAADQLLIEQDNA